MSLSAAASTLPAVSRSPRPISSQRRSDLVTVAPPHPRPADDVDPTFWVDDPDAQRPGREPFGRPLPAGRRRRAPTMDTLPPQAPIAPG